MRATVFEYVAGALVLVFIIAILAGCTPRPVVDIPVVQPCVRLAKISPEPGHVALSGDARHDASMLASTDLRLRAWGRELNALLVGCSG